MGELMWRESGLRDGVDIGKKGIRSRRKGLTVYGYSITNWFESTLIPIAAVDVNGYVFIHKSTWPTANVRLFVYIVSSNLTGEWHYVSYFMKFTRLNERQPEVSENESRQ